MRLIDADWILGEIDHDLGCYEIEAVKENDGLYVELRDVVKMVCAAPTIDPESLRPKGLYTAHEVAEIITDLFGDCCACNFNGIDEWLPEKCELQDVCPNTVGVACWEQYLKHREAKMEG